MRRAALLVVASALALLPVACGDDGDDIESAPRPPAEFEEMAAIFDPIVEPYGLVVTRAALVDLDGYDETPSGNHLALYVEPTEEYSTADYVDGVAELTNELTPLIFEKFSAIESYDICQEPLPEEDDQQAPPPITQVFITRDQADAIDFPIDLATLRALSEDEPRRIETLYVDETIERTAEWKDATPATS